MEVLQAKLDEVNKERHYQMKVSQDKIDDLYKQMRVIRKANALRGYSGD
jgi:TPP-dependent pyruvate/acetoin dehydrogenase alpha subunit